MNGEWADPRAARSADWPCGTEIVSAIPAIRHTDRARRDLMRLWLHIRDRNPAAADRFFQRIEARIAVLRDFPKIGTSRPDLARDARILAEPPYLILYRLVPDGVQIVRVICRANSRRNARAR